MVIGSISLLIALLFIFGSLPDVSFSKNAVNEELKFVNGVAGFMKVLPLAAWFFVGVEALSLASDRVSTPKTIIPFAQICCVLTLFITGTAILSVSVSLPPGIVELPGELVPFNNGFCRLFAISHRFATILSLPATYATAFGFMWCYGKLITSMANSGLLPPILAKTSSVNDTTYVSLIFGSLLSYLIFLAVHLNPGITAIAGFQGNGGVEILVFLGLVALLTLYYFAYARRKQTFSDQENRVLLVAHVMKFNVNRGKRPHAAAKKIQVRRSSSSLPPKP
ncbi:hypothetical protein Gpo141_00004005 [Globisporangium polare]